MTENEAKTILTDLAFDESKITDNKEVKALQKAVIALKEVQQYRAYKEIFESHFSKEALELLSDKEEFGKWLERGKWIAKRCDEINRKVEQFETIGTIEEFKALKEKNTPKKVIVKKSEIIELDVCDEKGNVHLCPDCNDYIVCADMKHCWNCGQALEH